jgi:hypothetical protein
MKLVLNILCPRNDAGLAVNRETTESNSDKPSVANLSGCVFLLQNLSEYRVPEKSVVE